jgi:hypothetical protein
MEQSDTRETANVPDPQARCFCLCCWGTSSTRSICDDISMPSMNIGHVIFLPTHFSAAVDLEQTDSETFSFHKHGLSHSITSHASRTCRVAFKPSLVVNDAKSPSVRLRCFCGEISR